MDPVIIGLRSLSPYYQYMMYTYISMQLRVVFNQIVKVLIHGEKMEENEKVSVTMMKGVSSVYD